MSNSRVRIIKDPEERKQEIIEAALHLFSQKGYEHTTIPSNKKTKCRYNITPSFFTSISIKCFPNLHLVIQALLYLKSILNLSLNTLKKT